MRPPGNVAFADQQIHHQQQPAATQHRHPLHQNGHGGGRRVHIVDSFYPAPNRTGGTQQQRTNGHVREFNWMKLAFFINKIFSKRTKSTETGTFRTNTINMNSIIRAIIKCQSEVHLPNGANAARLAITLTWALSNSLRMWLRAKSRFR